jgi:hypothetical protein
MATSTGAFRHLRKLGYRGNIVNLGRHAWYMHLTVAGPLLWLRRQISEGDCFSHFPMLQDDIYRRVGTLGQERASAWG